MRSEFQQFIEPTTESTRVFVATPNYELEGNIYLSRSMKENRRLTNLLNSDRRFIALTQVTIRRRQGSDQDAVVHPFIHVNLATIELIKPLDATTVFPED